MRTFRTGENISQEKVKAVREAITHYGIELSKSRKNLLTQADQRAEVDKAEKDLLAQAKASAKNKVLRHQLDSD